MFLMLAQHFYFTVKRNYATVHLQPLNVKITFFTKCSVVEAQSVKMESYAFNSFGFRQRIGYSIYVRIS